MSDQPSQEEIDEAEWLKPANWRAGIFYHSERDSRNWVPKRSMFGRRRYGGTPNFAKESARKLMMIIAGICVLLFLTVVTVENMYR